MQDLEVNTMKGENETNWTQAVQMAMARITRVTHAQQTENTGRAAEMRGLSRTTEQFALWLVDLWDLVGILFIPVDVQVLAAPTHVESLHVMPWWHGFQQAGDGWAEFWVAGLQWEVRHRWAQWEACYGLLVVYRFLDQWTDSWHFWAKTPYKSPFFSMVKLQSGSWETGAWNSALQEMAGGCRKDMSAAYFCCTCQLQSDQAHTFFHTWLWDFCLWHSLASRCKRLCQLCCFKLATVLSQYKKPHSSRPASNFRIFRQHSLESLLAGSFAPWRKLQCDWSDLCCAKCCEFYWQQMHANAYRHRSRLYRSRFSGLWICISIAGSWHSLHSWLLEPLFGHNLPNHLYSSHYIIHHHAQTRSDGRKNTNECRL